MKSFYLFVICSYLIVINSSENKEAEEEELSPEELKNKEVNEYI